MIMEETKAFEVDEDEGVQENIARIKGECHFLRGSYYFLLANFYGKPYDAATAATDPAVPIKVTPYVEDVFFQRNSVAEVYEQVEKDLLEAERLLKDIPQESLYQADVHAVRLMLSRMYLYMCNYEKAMEYASLVVEEGPALGDLNGFAGEQFLTPDLSEIIFSMGTNSLAENVAFTGGEPAGNDFSISSELYAAYDPTNSHDLRLQHYIVSENGYGKRSQVNDYRITNRGGKGVKTLSITDKTGRLVAIKNVTDSNDLMIINKSGIAIRLSVAECRVMGRATQGVRLINLSKKNDVIASVCKVMSSELEATVEEESRAQWTQKQEDIAEDIVSGTVSENEESKE